MRKENIAVFLVLLLQLTPALGRLGHIRGVVHPDGVISDHRGLKMSKKKKKKKDMTISMTEVNSAEMTNVPGPSAYPTMAMSESSSGATATEGLTEGPTTAMASSQMPQTILPTQSGTISASETTTPTAPGRTTGPETTTPTGPGTIPGSETASPTLVMTAAHTISPMTAEPVAQTESPTTAQCVRSEAQVSGTFVYELDPTVDYTGMEPTSAQIIGLAKYTLQHFGVLLRNTYGKAVRLFTATIDETKTALDGKTFPLDFTANILFSPCAPPAASITALFANANYTSILDGFQPTVNPQNNIFENLTGAASFHGKTVIQ